MWNCSNSFLSYWISLSSKIVCKRIDMWIFEKESRKEDRQVCGVRVFGDRKPERRI